MSTQEIASLDRVSFKYDESNLVLKNISIKFFSHSFYFITGSSGAGKTSLLRLLYLGLKPTAGNIKLFNTNTMLIPNKDVCKFRQKMGVVFQDLNLINNISVIDNVLLPLKIRNKINSKDSEKNARNLLSWVGLEEHLDAYPLSLSGGQKQRVAIARAVISNPELLIADEPTGNVDDEIAQKLLYLLENLCKSGTCIILATHNKNLIKQSSYDVIKLVNGRVSK